MHFEGESGKDEPKSIFFSMNSTSTYVLDGGDSNNKKSLDDHSDDSLTIGM